MKSRITILVFILLRLALFPVAQEKDRINIYRYSREGKQEQNRTPVPERFNTFSYGVNEGLLQSSLKDIAFDKNNFCWISLPNGIQIFDGKNFKIVPVQEGLPDDKWVNIFRMADGNLLIAHSMGISKYDIDRNRFRMIFTNPRGDNMPPTFLGESGNVIYIYQLSGKILGLGNRNFAVVSQSDPGFGNYARNLDYKPVISANIINDRIVFYRGRELILWDLARGKSLYRHTLPEPIGTRSIRMKSATEVFCFKTDENSLSLYDFSNATLSPLITGYSDNQYNSRSNLFYWQGRPVISMYNKLFEADSGFTEIKAELVNFQNQPIPYPASMARVAEDNYGNLFITTVNSGIRKILRNNYPIKYFGEEKQTQNFSLCVLPDKINNRVLVGAIGQGIKVYDTLQRLLKHFPYRPGKEQQFTPVAIIKNNEGDYLVFAWSEKFVWKLDKNLSGFTKIPIEPAKGKEIQGIAYYSKIVFQDERLALILTQGNLYKVDMLSGKITEHLVSVSHPQSAMLYKGDIITHVNDELIFIDTASFREKKIISFPNTGGVRSFASDDAGFIYLGSNKGIFKIDSLCNIKANYSKITGLPDECIYALTIDASGYIWCSTNKGILRISRKNGIFQLTKQDGLQENEFNTNVLSITGDSELYFGGVNGISSFFPGSINPFNETINIIITAIKINNSDIYKNVAVWNVSEIKLPYDENSISFDFIAMANNNPGQYVYQYKMEGIDDSWIQNEDLQTVRYFLPPGKYAFKIYASRLFDPGAAAIKEISIIILPPFWKTWWFLSLLALVTIAAIAFFTGRYNRKKYLRKLAGLESERKVQQERERMSRDLHDSIGAYAHAVIYNTELLEKEEDASTRENVMKDLKFASKDIITALRETIWALKKDNFTAEDCLVRIRNFIQPFNRYYNHIQFRVEGEAPPGMVLHYTRSLHLVRIIQEAVTNSIKYSGAANVIIHSSNSEGKWKLAVTDDGSGFDYESAVRNQAGNGLGNIMQRAAESSFDLTIKSSPGQGTSITIIV